MCKSPGVGTRLSEKRRAVSEARAEVKGNVVLVADVRGV